MLADMLLKLFEVILMFLKTSYYFKVAVVSPLIPKLARPVLLIFILCNVVMQCASHLGVVMQCTSHLGL